MNSQISLIGYAVAAAAFLVLFALLFSLWRDRMRGKVLALACLTGAIWAIFLATRSSNFASSPELVFIAEMTFDTAWLIFLASLLGGAVAIKSNWLVRRGGVVAAILLLLTGLLLEFAVPSERSPNVTGQLLVMGSIATSLFGLVGIEQLYRNVRPSQQNGLKFLCLGLGGIFAFDLLLYSYAVVQGQIQPLFWGVRGYVVTFCVPLIAISVKRMASWNQVIFASRQVVFYTSTLVAAGIYLSVVGLAGYYIKTLGREWGDALRLIFFSAAILCFLVIILSDQIRAKARVWITKHFLERKYDYRAEWLRLIHTLTTTRDQLPLKKRAIKALAQIVKSPFGHLWLRTDGGREFFADASWDVQPIDTQIDVDSKLAVFLSQKAWIIDVAEIETRPRKYDPLLFTDLPEQIAETAYIVPLIHETDMIGFVALASPKTESTLNFEDHDLLKTAGQQIASYLMQDAATKNLTESRQFEAYNRFTAFVMHDLKNAIAQQSLVVENAERHKRNPQFIDDAMDTIRGSVTRMRRVMGQLRQSAVDHQAEKVDLTKVLLEVISQCSDRDPVPIASVPERALIVHGNRERLSSAISHAIRNAQDASDADGEVRVEMEDSDGECRVLVVDKGCGMEPEFVKERLFRPFDSTKGSEGMGIGAYQVRETLRSCGGDIRVHSRIDGGTTMTLILPLIGADAT